MTAKPKKKENSSATTRNTAAAAAAAAETDHHNIASNWNTSSLPNHEVATLYESYKKKKYDNKCGHEVSLRRIVQRIQQGDKIATCPICSTPVAYVQQQEETNSDGRFVTFKYGKIVYRLNVKAESSPSQRQAAEHNCPWWMFWAHHHDGGSTTSVMTAQERIMDVLGIARGMKILHKGRVLYPVVSQPQTSEEPSIQQQRQLSQTLVDLSSSSSSSASTTTTTTTTLLVVGTPKQRQSEWLSHEQEQLQKQQQQTPTTAVNRQQNNRDLWTVVTTLTIGDVIRFGWYVTTESIRITTSILWNGFGWIHHTIFGRRNEHQQRQREQQQ